MKNNEVKMTDKQLKILTNKVASLQQTIDFQNNMFSNIIAMIRDTHLEPAILCSATDNNTDSLAWIVFEQLSTFIREHTSTEYCFTDFNKFIEKAEGQISSPFNSFALRNKKTASVRGAAWAYNQLKKDMDKLNHKNFHAQQLIDRHEREKMRKEIEDSLLKE